MLLVKDSETVEYIAVKRIHKYHSPLELSSSDTRPYNNTIILFYFYSATVLDKILFSSDVSTNAKITKHNNNNNKKKEMLTSEHNHITIVVF